MEGSAYHWFKFLRQKQEPTSEEFSVALIRRFGGRERISVFEQLAKIMEVISKNLNYWCLKRLMLQPKVRLLIKPHDPRELRELWRLSWT